MDGLPTEPDPYAINEHPHRLGDSLNMTWRYDTWLHINQARLKVDWVTASEMPGNGDCYYARERGHIMILRDLSPAKATEAMAVALAQHELERTYVDPADDAEAITMAMRNLISDDALLMGYLHAPGTTSDNSTITSFIAERCGVTVATVECRIHGLSDEQLLALEAARAHRKNRRQPTRRDIERQMRPLNHPPRSDAPQGDARPDIVPTEPAHGD